MALPATWTVAETTRPPSRRVTGPLAASPPGGGQPPYLKAGCIISLGVATVPAVWADYCRSGGLHVSTRSSQRNRMLPAGASAPSHRQSRAAPVGGGGKPTKKTQPGSDRRTVRTRPAPRQPASPAKTAKAAAAAHKLDDESIAPLAALIGATRAWLTPLTISQVGPRIAIAWMLLHRRDGNVPTAGDVYERAGVLGLHPHITRPPMPADGRNLAETWRQIILTETTTALLVAGWLTPIDHPENLALGETARTYLRRQNIRL